MPKFGDRRASAELLPAADAPPLDRLGSACLDRLGGSGRWMRTNASLFGDGWDYVHAEREGGCRMRTGAAAREAAAGRWVLVVGDSRARFLFSALLTLLNQSLPAAGWPTHRVVGPVGQAGCTPHAPAAAAREEYWGYYDPVCQARYKGPCFDDSRGRGTRGVCTLDYTTPLRTRLTFQWHSFNEPAHLSAMSERVERLVTAAGRAPDLVVTSTGAWDMIFAAASADCCCESIGQAMATINHAIGAAKLPDGPGSAAPPLRVLYGFFTCPSCAAQGKPEDASADSSVEGVPEAAHANAARGGGCGNWAAPPNMEALTRKTHACARATAEDAGFAYFDVDRSIHRAPPLLSSPCGNQHAFGVQAEAEAGMLLGALGASQRAWPRPDRTADGFWDEWAEFTLGPLL
eukprot:2809702-Prymnesium_polylepis.1